MSDPQKKKDSQASLILRIAGGAYLLYLAWDLREAVFGGQPLYSIPIVIFAAVGAALVAFSIVPLIKGDYMRPGDEAQEVQEAQDTQEAQEVQETQEAQDTQEAQEIQETQAPDAPAVSDTLPQDADEDASHDDQ